MKLLKHFALTVLLAGVLATPFTVGATDEKKAEKSKPYPLKTCLVSDEELDSMGKSYVFVYQGQEIKLCCKSCMKDFKKDPAQYMKKLDAASPKNNKN